ncbi:MAG: acyltransferase family protein, partial [Candidatus Heimdallarchaeaceae archaeon]
MADTAEKSTSGTFTELERRYDLDWLRVITIFFVFIYHCTKFFDSDPFNVKNNPVDFLNDIHISNLKISANTIYLTSIGLPLFFIIAGMSMFYALGYLEKKEIKTSKYVLLRFIRLIVPYIIGLFTYISLLVFLEWTNKGFISMSFFAFYPSYYNGIYGFGGSFSVFGHHLWFLVVLFLFTSVILPLFVYLRKEKFRSSFSRIASFFTRPGTIYLLIIPIFGMEVIHSLVMSFIPRLGGWDFFTYIFFLLFGYLLAYDKQFRKSLKKNFIIAIILGVFSVVALICMNIFYFDAIWVNSDYTIIEVMFTLSRVIFSWSCLIIILNLADRFLNKKSKTVKILNELVLPFYIIHFIVISVVGFFVVQLNYPIIIEFLLIFLISIVAVIPVLFLIS